jgi:non-ribosomal peptide synthase protein (TIGR01720 family)
MTAFASILARRAEQAPVDPASSEWLGDARADGRALPWPKRGALTRSPDDVVAFESSLDETETSHLLGELQRSRRVTLEEVTVSAAVSALAEWGGERSLLIDMLMSARQVDIEGVDLTRSLGWFSTIYPLHVDFRDASTPMQRLASTVDAMRAVRHREHEYGMLRYMSTDAALKSRLAEMPQADVFFAYFGHIDAPEAGYARDVGDGLFRVDPAATDMKRTMMGAFRYVLEIAVYMRAGRLHMAWLFNQTLLSPEVVGELAERCTRSLRTLAGSGVTTSAQDGGFSEPGLAPEQVDLILAELSQGL